MNFGIAVWLITLAFVLCVWLFMATEWGFVQRFDDVGFSVRTILGTRRVLSWTSVANPVIRFTSFLPRFGFRFRQQRFVSWHGGLSVLIRQRPEDQAFAKAVEERFEILTGERLANLFARKRDS